MKALLVASAAAFAAVQAGQPPRFTTSTTLVRLDVGVSDSRGPVRGLLDREFVVTDSGVRQTVRVEEVADAPLDIVLVVQPIPSVAVLSSGQQERMKPAIVACLDRVDARDRLGVILAGAPPIRLRGLQEGKASLDISAFSSGAFAASWDALAAALGEFHASDRRPVLIAVVNGVDARSTISFDALAERARRLGPTFVMVGSPVKVQEVLGVTSMTSDGRFYGAESRAAVSGFVFPATLELLAHRTGGVIVNLGKDDPERMIGDLFVWLRTRYLVSYEPPPGKGWHPVSVSVNRKDAKVTARDGYLVD